MGSTHMRLTGSHNPPPPPLSIILTNIKCLHTQNLGFNVGSPEITEILKCSKIESANTKNFQARECNITGMFQNCI